MKKGVYIQLFTLLIGLFSTNVMAQKGVEDGSRYGHGNDSIQCITNLSLYREYARQGDFKSALPSWRKVFHNCPRATKNIYIDGARMFQNFIEENQNDEAKKGAYVDTLMMVYDQRIKYYKDRSNVRGRQGVDLLRYRRNDGIQYIQQAYNYLDESIQADKAHVSEPVMATYISASLTLFQDKKITQNQVISDYMMVSDIINKKLETRPSDATLTAIKSSIDNNFAADGPSDCDTLNAYFNKEYQSRSDDPDFLGMLTTLLKNNSCTNSQLFYNASTKLQALKPSAESAANIALMAYNNGNYKEAATYYKQAIQLQTDDMKKADYYLGLALTQSKLNQYSESRDNALKAEQLHSNWGEPYLLIGQIYAQSQDQCSNIKLPSSVFWVAVDKFNEAKKVDPSVEEKANKLIITYSKYYPKKEDAFFQNVHQGDTYTVGCWINENTIARFNE